MSMDSSEDNFKKLIKPPPLELILTADQTVEWLSTYAWISRYSKQVQGSILMQALWMTNRAVYKQVVGTEFDCINDNSRIGLLMRRVANFPHEE